MDNAIYITLAFCNVTMPVTTLINTFNHTSFILLGSFSPVCWFREGLSLCFEFSVDDFWPWCVEHQAQNFNSAISVLFCFWFFLWLLNINIKYFSTIYFLGFFSNIKVINWYSLLDKDSKQCIPYESLLTPSRFQSTDNHSNLRHWLKWWMYL